MSEKRKFMRFNVLLNAICRTQGTSKKLRVNNFSREGLGILCEDMLNAGNDIEIEMMIPGDNVPVLLHGEVAWSSSPDSGEGYHKSGIKFKKVRNNDRSKILEYIYHKWIMPDNAAAG